MKNNQTPGKTGNIARILKDVQGFVKTLTWKEFISGYEKHLIIEAVTKKLGNKSTVVKAAKRLGWGERTNLEKVKTFTSYGKVVKDVIAKAQHRAELPRGRFAITANSVKSFVMVPVGYYNEPTEEHPVASFFSFDLEILNFKDMWERAEYSTDSRDLDVIGSLYKNVSLPLEGISIVKFAEVNQDILIFDKKGGFYRWINVNEVNLFSNSEITLMNNFKVKKVNPVTGEESKKKWTTTTLDGLYSVQQGDIIKVFHNRDEVGDALSIYVPGNAKKREDYFVRVDAILAGKIPGIKVIDGKIHYMTAGLKFSDYFHKLLELHPYKVSKAILIKKVADKDPSPILGLIAGNYASIKGNNGEIIFPVLRMCQEMRWTDKSGKVRIKSSFLKKDGSMTLNWYSVRDFLAEYHEDPFIGKNIIHRDNAGEDEKSFVKVYLPYTHPDLMVARVSAGHNGYVLLYKVPDVSYGTKVTIANKGMCSMVIGTKGIPKKYRDVDFIFNQGSNSKFEDWKVVEANKTIKIGERKAVVDIIETTTIFPYPGEFRSKLYSPNGVITVRMISDQCFFNEQDQNEVGAPTRKRLSRKIDHENDPEIPIIKIDAFKNIGIKRAEMLLKLLSNEKCNLHINGKIFYLDKGEIVTGEDNLVISSLASCLMRYAEEPSIEEWSRIVHMYDNTIFTIFNKNGSPTYRWRDVINGTIIAIDPDTLKLPPELVGTAFLVAPAAYRKEIKWRYPFNFNTRSAIATRAPKLSLDNGIEVRILFTDEVGFTNAYKGIEIFEPTTFVWFVPYYLLDTFNADSDGDTLSVIMNMMKAFPKEKMWRGIETFAQGNRVADKEIFAAVHGKEIVPEMYAPVQTFLNHRKQSFSSSRIGLFTNRLSHIVKNLYLHADPKKLEDNLETVNGLAADTQEKTVKYKSEKAVAWVTLQDVFFKSMFQKRQRAFIEEDALELTLADEFVRSFRHPRGMSIGDYIRFLVKHLRTSAYPEVAKPYLYMLDTSIEDKVILNPTKKVKKVVKSTKKAKVTKKAKKKLTKRNFSF